MFNIITSWRCKNRKKNIPLLQNSKTAVLVKCRKLQWFWASKSQQPCYLWSQQTSRLPCPQHSSLFLHLCCARTATSSFMDLWTEQPLSSYQRFHKADVILLLLTGKKQCKLVGRWFSSTYESNPLPMWGVLCYDLHCSYKVKDVHCHPGA